MSRLNLDIDRIVVRGTGISLDAERFGEMVHAELLKALGDAGSPAPSKSIDLKRVVAPLTGNAEPRSLARTLAQSIGKTMQKAG